VSETRRVKSSLLQKHSWISQVEAIMSDTGTGIGMASHPCILVSQMPNSTFSARGSSSEGQEWKETAARWAKTKSLNRAPAHTHASFAARTAEKSSEEQIAKREREHRDSCRAKNEPEECFNLCGGATCVGLPEAVV